MLDCFSRRVRSTLPSGARAIIALLLFNTLASGETRQIWDPPAIIDKPDYRDYIGNDFDVADLVAIGRRLFVAKFNVLDGAGRPGATGDSKPTTRSVGNNLQLTRVAGPDA